MGERFSQELLIKAGEAKVCEAGNARRGDVLPRGAWTRTSIAGKVPLADTRYVTSHVYILARCNVKCSQPIEVNISCLFGRVTKIGNNYLADDTQYVHRSHPCELNERSAYAKIGDELTLLPS